MTASRNGLRSRRRSRAWSALTDYREFREWFRVKLDGPFIPGQVSRGNITYPGYEHVRWETVVEKMEPQRLFSFLALVEFRLEKTANSTLLMLTESGSDKIPSGRRLGTFNMNEGGWTEQMKNIETYVAQKP
jgi:Activator of Hsp90 ATPase homolog 1-like protein